MDDRGEADEYQIRRNVNKLREVSMDVEFRNVSERRVNMYCKFRRNGE